MNIDQCQAAAAERDEVGNDELILFAVRCDYHRRPEANRFTIVTGLIVQNSHRRFADGHCHVDRDHFSDCGVDQIFAERFRQEMILN
ncbi:MAG: hypothetical protein HY081_08510 [Gammaproteobacteria bacterium]|nr:hypothetical protein [Gammaproteobacteria bacterium]